VSLGWVDDLGPTGTGQPDQAAVEPALQVSAAPVLGIEGNEGGKDVWHEG
jgi:hypothetical protein